MLDPAVSVKHGHLVARSICVSDSLPNDTKVYGAGDTVKHFNPAMLRHSDLCAVKRPQSPEEITMSVQATMDAFIANVKAGNTPYKIPPEVFRTMERATAELVASGLAKKALKVGDKAPGFALLDSDGKLVSSASLLAQGPLVVTFYRGVWCPYCNMELQALEAVLPALNAAGANLVAISPQKAVNSRKSQRENKLTLRILGDPGNELAALYGLRFSLPDYLIDLYKNTLGNDLAAVNGDDIWTLPMPARFIIGQDGVILYAEVNPNYTHRPEPADLLPFLSRASVKAA